MFKFLLPKETEFFNYFEQHCDLIIQASRKLVELSENGVDALAVIKSISILEKEADSVTHNCVLDLQKTFITPFDRNHIHELIKGLDDIMDTVEDVAAKIVVYEINIRRPEMKKLAELILEACLFIFEGVKNMRNLKNAPAIDKMVVETHRLEHEADVILREAIRQLFHDTDHLKEVIQWKEILEELEKVTDCCEDVSDIIQGIVIEAS